MRMYVRRCDAMELCVSRSRLHRRHHCDSPGVPLRAAECLCCGRFEDGGMAAGGVNHLHDDHTPAWWHISYPRADVACFFTLVCSSTPPLRAPSPPPPGCSCPSPRTQSTRPPIACEHDYTRRHNTFFHHHPTMMIVVSVLRTASCPADGPLWAGRRSAHHRRRRDEATLTPPVRRYMYSETAAIPPSFQASLPPPSLWPAMALRRDPTAACCRRVITSVVCG